MGEGRKERCQPGWRRRAAATNFVGRAAPRKSGTGSAGLLPRCAASMLLADAMWPAPHPRLLTATSPHLAGHSCLTLRHAARYRQAAAHVARARRAADGGSACPASRRAAPRCLACSRCLFIGSSRFSARRSRTSAAAATTSHEHSSAPHFGSACAGTSAHGQRWCGCVAASSTAHSQSSRPNGTAARRPVGITLSRRIGQAAASASRFRAGSQSQSCW
jgi:hypothetical protein